MTNIQSHTDRDLLYRTAEALGASDAPTWDGTVADAYTRLTALGQSFEKQAVNSAMIEELDELADILDRVLDDGNEHGDLLPLAASEMRRRASLYRTGLASEEESAPDIVYLTDGDGSLPADWIQFMDHSIPDETEGNSQK